MYYTYIEQRKRKLELTQQQLTNMKILTPTNSSNVRIRSTEG